MRLERPSATFTHFRHRPGEVALRLHELEY